MLKFFIKKCKESTHVLNFLSKSENEKLVEVFYLNHTLSIHGGREQKSSP